MAILRVFFLAVLLFTFGQCTVETAHEPDERELVIASDYLVAADSLLFSDFAKKNDVHVRIVHLDATVIHDQLTHDGPNSEIDLLMLESENDVLQFAIHDLLQALPKNLEIQAGIKKYASTRYHYTGFGLDPFIVTTPSGGRSIISTYDDLTRLPFVDELTPADRIGLLSPACRKMDKGKAQIWLHAYLEHAGEPILKSDTLGNPLPRLMKRSQYYEECDTIRARDRVPMRILTTGKAGSFYNLRTFAMASQCSHYSEACAFIEFYLVSWRNKALCRSKKIVSVHAVGETFRPYKTRTEDLMEYHTIVERLLNRLDSH